MYKRLAENAEEMANTNLGEIRKAQVCIFICFICQFWISIKRCVSRLISIVQTPLSSFCFCPLHQRYSSIKISLPSKDVKGVFHQRSFYQKISYINGCLQLRVIFHQKLSSIKGHLPSSLVFNG